MNDYVPGIVIRIEHSLRRTLVLKVMLFSTKD